MSSNTNIIFDDFGESSDWIELYNSWDYPASIGGYGLTDDSTDLYKWTFPPTTINSNDYLLIFASGVGTESNVQHWETIVDWGDTWTYYIGNQEPPLNWKDFGFLDDSWLSGPSGFGYGDGDDATIVPNVMSVFLRKTFYLDSLADIAEILLHVDYDDAFVAYINGIEIARSNIGDSSDGPPPYNQGANEWHEAVIFSGGFPEKFDVDLESTPLQDGENILAIQVHNYNESSSDMSLIPFLTLGLSYVPDTPSGAPDILNLDASSLHANFRISSNGEEIILTDPLYNIVDQVDSLVIPNDVSFGRKPDGDESWLFFDEPTPNSTNNNSVGFESSCQAPQFISDPGFYNGSIIVSIEQHEDFYPIFYTVDGSEPTDNSNIYSQSINISETTVLRASVIHPNCLFSEVSTGSFFINEDRNLPIISLTSDPYNLFDNEYGIYVMGNDAEWNFPHFGANFWEDWERPVYVEFFEQNGEIGFSLDAGVKIFGGWSRGMPQKSLAIYARPDYGTSEINYQIFPDKDIDSFVAIVLRNSGNEWFGNEAQANATMFRDGMHTSLMDNSGVEHQEYRPSAVYINGEYWGIHNIREKVNEEFLASNNPGVDPDELDELEFGGDIIEGDNQDYLDMIDFIDNNDLSNQANYLVVEEQIDIENFIDYYIIQIYVGNTDWPGNNIKFWRPHIEGAKWKWILYDTDFGSGLFNWASNVYHNTLLFALNDNGPDWPNPPWSTLLFRNLMENEEFQNKFINHFCYYLSTRFEPSYVENHITDIVDNIAPEMPNHVSRWGGDILMWNQNINYVQNFGALRADIVFNHVGEYFGLNESSTLNLTVNPSDAGFISVENLIAPGNTWSGEYFNGIPIEISAFSNPGYTFSHWTGENISNQSISVTLDENQYLTAVFVENDAPSVLVINELLATNQSTNTDEEEEYEDWVELYFDIPGLMNLNGYFLTDDINDPEKWMFPDVEISGQGHLLIWADDDIEDGYLHTNFKLASEGESIALFDPNLNLIDYIEFGQQNDDISYGRYPDGHENWIFFNQPTPESSNEEGSPCYIGDINCDSVVNVLDVVQLVSFILGNSELTNVQQQLADINFDENIDVLDIVLMISIILDQ